MNSTSPDGPNVLPTGLPPAPADLARQVANALDEDIGPGDLTAALIPTDRLGRATVISRETAVVCGRPYVDACFAAIDRAVRIDWAVAEGSWVRPDQTLFELSGPARALLTGERTALNFLQLLSATATAARSFAALVAGTNCVVLDTRKTIPGLRTAQKYAVRVGGAQNHRVGLFDAILIKENHIIAAGGIAAAVARARELHRGVPVEVEVENIDELRATIEAGADAALIDDFTLERMREAVAINRAAPRPIKLEASGGVSAENLRAIADTGVDFVSIGAMTKNVRAVDLSMRFC
ncbi:MAG: carboxylating nicotinate-nucleotide diphosphorylase [Gammaproteobacteria bacterium]|nr:carboxylating nicotinate-nucleotide diphosphorylase [Gammaproteobacteria bacterium]